ncbi:MAG TPA: nucleoside-diphosphate sugar epimerase/dehydratase [Pyrinomonadaceae bacterium]|nr:nucleoside-diphosphate sugar epimerase/dehydratase [Pyrinomonadaceae bacterium]
MRLNTYDRYFKNSFAESLGALIIGIGEAAALLVDRAQQDCNLRIRPLGFIDVDSGKLEHQIRGLPVMGNLQDLREIAQTLEIELVIIALPTAASKTIREVVAICKQARLPVCMLTGSDENSGHRSPGRLQLRDVEIEDLLRQDTLEINEDGLRQAIHDHRILVTGAGGSIGAELCRQIAKYRPSELVLLGHGEHSIFTLASELSHLHPRLKQVRVIADVRDANRLHKTFAACRPHIVFHAAAHKHVTLMEENLEDAVTNNILGTNNVVNASLANDIQNLILISSDKAVNPTSVMGATKRVAELIICQAAKSSGRCYVSVRFGNVLGSRGSVLSIFHDQINNGGPVTVTHPEMSRYFMTIAEAVHLVLQAMLFGKGGEVFVLDMGEPLKIADLARYLIQFAGLEEGRDINIEFTGVRHGEKLFEELFLLGDKYERTEHQKIFMSRNGSASARDSTDVGSNAPSLLKRQLEELRQATRIGDRELILTCLRRIVPEYKAPESSIHDAASA